MHPEKQDTALVYEALAWLELNKKRVIAGGVVLLAVVVAGYVYTWMRSQTRLQANQALLELRTGDNPRTGTKAATPADFLKVAGEYPSTETAARARLLAAGGLFDGGKYAEALAEFKKAEQSDDSGLLAPIAALGVAASLDSLDKPEDALAAYQEVVTKYGDQPVATRARLAMAVLHESRNQPQQALKIYDDLASSRTAGRASMEAAMKRETLLKAHPELAPTNAPVTAPEISAQVISSPAAKPATNAPAAK
jgi:predicted negative regulator of RcsB-dependent stress response